MKIAYYEDDSKKLKGWYDKDIHKNIPIPNITVSEDVWEEATSKGFNCIDVETKTLFLKDFRTAEETEDNLKNIFKQNRATIMNSIGWIHERIQSQTVIIQGGYTITAKYTVAQAIEYYLYKQELRDRPSIITDWTSISYPVVPQHVYDAMEKEIKALCQELQCDPVV